MKIYMKRFEIIHLYIRIYYYKKTRVKGINSIVIVAPYCPRRAAALLLLAALSPASSRASASSAKKTWAPAAGMVLSIP